MNIKKSEGIFRIIIGCFGVLGAMFIVCYSNACMGDNKFFLCFLILTMGMSAYYICIDYILKGIAYIREIHPSNTGTENV